MPSEYDALLDAQPAQQKSEYDALLEEPKQEGGVLSGIAAGIGRALNPINLIKGALDIGGESDISKIKRYSASLTDIVSGKPVQQALEQNIPEIAQQRAALTGQLGGREQAAEITGLGLQAGLLALPFAHGKLASLRETAFGKTEAPLASETAASEVAKPEVLDRQLLVQPERRFTTVDEPPPEIAPARNIMETARYQPTSRPGEEPPLAPEAFPSISQSAEEARRVARTTETGIQSETAKIGGELSATQEGVVKKDSIVQHPGDGEGGTSAEASGSGSTIPGTEVQTQKIGGESEKVQVQKDEGKRREGVLTPEAQKLVESGGVPGFVSKNLERIATENGVEVGNKTPNQIIDELKGRAAKVQPPAAPPVVDSAEPTVSRIANRFTQERSASGEIGEIAPGQGYSTKELLQRGLKMPPEQINQHISDLMQKSGGDPIEQASAVRANEAQLSQRSNQLSREAEADAGNMEKKLAADNAFKDLTDFHNGPLARIKEIFHGTGQSMQQEIPIDLSTFNGMKEAWLKDTGKSPPPEVEPLLRTVSKKVAGANGEADASVDKLGDAVEKATKSKRLPTHEQVRDSILERLKNMPCK